MNTQTVAILGCAKNCANYINNSINNMIKIGKMFKNYKIIIFENDSKDNTNNILEKISQSNKKIIVISQKYIENIYPHRTWCIAYARQKCSDILKNSEFNPNYVVVMDMDDIGAKGNASKVISIMMAKSHLWDIAVPRPTYDLWALRFKNHNINFIESSKILQNMLDAKGLNDEVKYEIKLYNNYLNELKTFTNDINNYDSNGLLSVYSSFNGIAIYKYEFYIKGIYSGKNIYYSNIKNHNNRFPEECEHVNFHKSIGPCRFNIVWDAIFI